MTSTIKYDSDNFFILKIHVDALASLRTTSYAPVLYTDRQTDILLTEIKVITDLFVIVIREIYVHVYTRMLVC